MQGTRQIGLAVLAGVWLMGCVPGRKGPGGPEGMPPVGQGNPAAPATPPAEGGTSGSAPAPTPTPASDPGPGLPPVPAPPPVAVRTTPTQGSAVAITRDDRYAVAANRTAGRVTVFRLAFGGATPATKLYDLDVGADAQPWAVVIGNDDDTAYVILRKEQRLVRINHLRAAPAVDPTRVPTGSEPTGLAISPTGATLFVASWAEGTVTAIDAARLAVVRTVDLNPALAGSELLGDEVAARPGLAHPRALVVTNNGDERDDDETVFVSEFFAQARLDGEIPDDDSQFDLGRQGLVYSFGAGDGEVGPLIPIAPVADTGFPDSRGQTTGCFPNQLQAMAINAGRLYVTAVCESPRGPVGPDKAPVAPGTATSNFKTQVHAAVFVIDVETRRERPEQGLLLPREFDRLYAASGRPDDASRRIPLIPNDIMFAAGTTIGYVSGYGSDAVFRIAYQADGRLERVGAATQPFIDLKPAGNVPAGELPVGIASANTGVATVPFALAINESTRNLTVINFGPQVAVAAVPATDPPAPGLATSINRGRKFFVTGLGRWSLGGQAWNSCESCHPDGLTDNVSWFFARGPRQTISLDGSYDPRDGRRRRVLNWTGIFDEIHDFELNTRGNSGGVGALVSLKSLPPVAGDQLVFDGALPVAAQLATGTPQAGLNGSTISLMPRGVANPRSVLPDWDDIDEYVKVVRAPRAPVGLDPGLVAAGWQLFGANGCAACHGGSQWTISTVFYTPSEENNGAQGLLRSTLYSRPPGFPVALNPPSAAGPAPLRFAGAAAGDDQINCVLREVGTFPAAGPLGIAAPGVTVKEVRQDMNTPAQGATGFNIPSLLGVGAGAPYFHAGAARTLEEALGDPAFDRHRRAFAENFQPDAAQLRQLAAFLLSIDEEAAPPEVPALGFGFDLCAEIPAGAVK